MLADSRPVLVMLRLRGAPVNSVLAEPNPFAFDDEVELQFEQQTIKFIILFCYNFAANSVDSRITGRYP